MVPVILWPRRDKDVCEAHRVLRREEECRDMVCVMDEFGRLVLEIRRGVCERVPESPS